MIALITSGQRMLGGRLPPQALLMCCLVSVYKHILGGGASSDPRSTHVAVAHMLLSNSREVLSDSADSYYSPQSHRPAHPSRLPPRPAPHCRLQPMHVHTSAGLPGLLGQPRVRWPTSQRQQLAQQHKAC